jgi:hypothetical protein
MVSSAGICGIFSGFEVGPTTSKASQTTMLIEPYSILDMLIPEIGYQAKLSVALMAWLGIQPISFTTTPAGSWIGQG